MSFGRAFPWPLLSQLFWGLWLPQQTLRHLVLWLECGNPLLDSCIYDHFVFHWWLCLRGQWHLQEVEPCCVKQISELPLRFYSPNPLPVFCFLTTGTTGPAILLFLPPWLACHDRMDPFQLEDKINSSFFKLLLSHIFLQQWRKWYRKLVTRNAVVVELNLNINLINIKGYRSYWSYKLHQSGDAVVKWFWWEFRRSECRTVDNKTLLTSFRWDLWLYWKFLLKSVYQGYFIIKS